MPTVNKNFTEFIAKNLLYVILCLFLIAVYIVYIVVFSIGTEDSDFNYTIVISSTTNGFCLFIAIISLVIVVGFIGMKLLDYYYK